MKKSSPLDVSRFLPFIYEFMDNIEEFDKNFPKKKKSKISVCVNVRPLLVSLWQKQLGLHQAGTSGLCSSSSFWKAELESGVF